MISFPDVYLGWDYLGSPACWLTLLSFRSISEVWGGKKRKHACSLTRGQARENVSSYIGSISREEWWWLWLTNRGLHLHTPTSVCKKINEVGRCKLKSVDVQWENYGSTEAQKQGSKSLLARGGGGHGNWFQEPTLNKKKGLNLQQAGICSKNYLISFFVCLWCIGNPMQSLCQTSFLSQRTLTKCLLHHEMIISHQQYRRKKRRIIIKKICYSDTEPRTLLKGNKGFMIYPHDFFLTLKRIPHYQQTTGKWK